MDQQKHGRVVDSLAKVPRDVDVVGQGPGAQRQVDKGARDINAWV
jgi:hypothetical protein